MKRNAARTTEGRAGMKGKRLIIANPHGFCAGVRHAVEIVETALALAPPPLYCLKELVHNRQVVDDLVGRGVRFVQDVRDVPRGAWVLFSAHGVPPGVREAARQRDLRVLDATCPYVSRVHAAVKRRAREGYGILLVGHRDHDEIAGVRGEAPDRVTVIETPGEARTVPVADPARVAVVTQTTLGVEDTARILDILRGRFPAMRTSPESDICFATHNRQKAARQVAACADRMLVLGSEKSSNSRRLVEVSRAAGCPASLVSAPSDLDAIPLAPVNTLGLTAGASTPERFVQQVIERLRAAGFTAVEARTVVEEDVRFPLPRALRTLRGPGRGVE
jgi:4-hydroxy-3-methylbut-2-en-1-yl diphosphate reductase